MVLVTVGRGPVPRQATHDDAADSYPENLDTLGNPDSDLNDREGQALALRWKRWFAVRPAPREGQALARRWKRWFALRPVPREGQALARR